MAVSLQRRPAGYQSCGPVVVHLDWATGLLSFCICQHEGDE